MTNFNFAKKTINPMNKKTFGGRSYMVFITITPNRKDVDYFSISGVEGPLSSGNCLGGCGQIDMHLKKENRKEWTYQKGFNDEIMDKLFDIWDKYHLKKSDDIPSEVVDFLNSLSETKVRPAWA